MKVEEHLFTCSCSHRDHDLVAIADAEDDCHTIYLNVRLHRHPLRQRIGQAWRLLWGRSCGYGTVTEFLVKSEDLPRFRKVLDDFERATGGAK